MRYKSIRGSQQLYTSNFYRVSTLTAPPYYTQRGVHSFPFNPRNTCETAHQIALTIHDQRKRRSIDPSRNHWINRVQKNRRGRRRITANSPSWKVKLVGRRDGKTLREWGEEKRGEQGEQRRAGDWLRPIAGRHGDPPSTKRKHCQREEEGRPLTRSIRRSHMPRCDDDTILARVRGRFC
ncbi:hypothetical protein JAAARDRAFT_327066 [Jaapia argillacea MUCL 33604]|uniref:Uncharacterized protein n=1 Tax=Jaapia argillacea MUCL 33604 TaxID=933084 RepID=A0A067PLD3_9AGAM|nr:hypothetical protein JAAARDRAFT_327066 [Jaapia argillacea MUCL 33604]